MTAPTTDSASVINADDVSYIQVKPTLQESSAGLMHYIRTTLQQAQEITQVVSEAESIADEASKYCEAIRAQHNIVPKKFALHGKGQTPVPPLASNLTKEIQSSVVWTQTMLEMCSMAESAERLEPGAKLSFLKRSPGETAPVPA
eukprot:gnl/MRDRNA2_/MRDRNA2_96672_c0_seq1.p2 gnl/MRDRNA2_/MRDRNA2_96672_c0~~gnl/MRDRNA2_/MRDRNA2_96672_c0_seq1.p2  ORF type:complete len:145 (+),score=26.03 gnl/MRDRNA2_/MRDRNA2_96672_c0_seq1:90-524(+)